MYVYIYIYISLSLSLALSLSLYIYIYMMVPYMHDGASAHGGAIWALSVERPRGAAIAFEQDITRTKYKIKHYLQIVAVRH